MGLLGASCSFTRFRIADTVPRELWMEIPAKLKQFAFQDIDEIAEERAWGWVSFEDMLDSEWRSAPPDKGLIWRFALRLDTQTNSAGSFKEAPSHRPSRRRKTYP